jgi:TIR domain/YARHG domain
MNDIFISYAREDKPWARRLAEALEGRGWSVWWDAEIPPGETWDEVIERELTAAKAVVVLWSQAAVKKRWVKTEASLALDANKLIPVLIDQALPPIAFRPIQAASLADWRGGPEHEGFAQLAGSIERLAGAPQPGGTAPVVGPGLADATAPPLKPTVAPKEPPSAQKRRWPLIIGAGGAAVAAAIAGLVLLPGAAEKDGPAKPGASLPIVTPPSDPPRNAPVEAAVAPPATPLPGFVPGSVPGRYPQASQRQLTDADLSADELRLMRNEIFARKGYIFNDAGLRAYFSAQPWYRPVSRDDVRLSAVEQFNVAKIRAFEQVVDKINR